MNESNETIETKIYNAITNYKKGQKIDINELIINVRNSFLISPPAYIPGYLLGCSANAFYATDPNLKLGSDVGEEIQEKITTVYNILSSAYMLSDKVNVYSFTQYNGAWKQNIDSVPFSSNLIIFEDGDDLQTVTKNMKTTKSPTIIYDTRKINKNDYPEGITMRDYFKLHTIQDFNKEFEKDEPPTKANYAIECMKLTRHILKNFENVIYLSRGLYLMDEKCKISYDNGERSLTAENLRYGRKIFYLSNPSDYSGALLLAINHINNELTPDAYQQITQDLNIWY